MDNLQIVVATIEILVAAFFIWHYFKHKNLANSIIENANSKSASIIENAKGEALKVTKHAYEEKELLRNELETIKNTIDNYDLDYQRSQILKDELLKTQSDINAAQIELESLKEKHQLAIKNQRNKIKYIKLALERSKVVLENYFKNNSSEIDYRHISNMLSELQSLEPTVELPLKSLEYNDLRLEIKEVFKQIQSTLDTYESRYTTKNNRSIYQLMVIALKSELQNVLFNLKFTNLDKSLEAVKSIVEKYINITADGNQTIKPTILKFIAEIELLFTKAVNVEYEYYVRQVKIKEEQQLLKDRMKQEALELKQLAVEREKLLKEESKFNAEIASIKEKLEQTIEEDTISLLKERIQELENQLADVSNKKEQILDLQNGKAGYVYVISNLGSFGDKMFKVGMTRRLNPQDRIDELGDASVPFKFDVHSFIFSEDAVSLETALHKRLESQRVNKMTLRKEFFYSTVDELERLVFEIQPTAAFCKTMLAEQYRQSLSISEQNRYIKK